MSIAAKPLDIAIFLNFCLPPPQWLPAL